LLPAFLKSNPGGLRVIKSVIKNRILFKKMRFFNAFLFAAFLILAFWVGKNVPPTWTVEKVTLDVHQDDNGKSFYVYRNKPTFIDDIVPLEEARSNPESRGKRGSVQESSTLQEEIVYEILEENGQFKKTYYKLIPKVHWKYWSLLPALIAVIFCWLTREPITALSGGIIAGALLLGKYDITGEILIPSLSSTNSATILILYLWLLGGLMGVWSRTGAAQAFAEFMTRNFVRGPRSAKLVTWGLGVVFFQGGTMSTVLVGTTVKPISDKERISHEELSYIVDSTASPIASQLAFNAWPGYIQAFIFVSGAGFLATEADRITFFFKSVPFCFYAIFAVLGTLLLSLDKSLFLGQRLKAAIKRARETGKLDADGAEPLSSEELQKSNIPQGYKPNVWEFFVPLFIIIGTAIGTFISKGSPEVVWAFSLALLSAMGMALGRGMSLKDLMLGFHTGIKGVVLGSIILLLAITIGGISKETGGGIYLVELLGGHLPYWILPVSLQVLTIIIAFSTGTSWGTYAVAFPLAMPLAWAVANENQLAHPQLFMTLCFAAVMDGSVFGDQCSPISDTTVLSSVCTGCDLMDHVKTQIPQATVASILAAICWTVVTVLFT